MPTPNMVGPLLNPDVTHMRQCACDVHSVLKAQRLEPLSQMVASVQVAAPKAWTGKGAQRPEETDALRYMESYGVCRPVNSHMSERCMAAKRARQQA